MRIIIYGAGAVGGVIGAQLHMSGQDVVLIARGEHLQALREHGLRYQTPSEDITLPMAAFSSPAEFAARDDDVVLLAMKTQHTEASLADLLAARGPDIPVVCCQNGVANERFASRFFNGVYAMYVDLPAQFTEPGRVQSHARPKPGVLDLGLYPGGSDDLALEIARGLEQAGFSAKADADIMRLKYAKLLMNLGNAPNAILPKGAGTKDIVETLREEARACYRAAGIDCASEDEALGRRHDTFEFAEISGVERAGGSSLQSLMRGTGDIETDYLNGEIVELGRLHGVATPANAVFLRLANELARSKGPPRSIAVEQVLQSIADERA